MSDVPLPTDGRDISTYAEDMAILAADPRTGNGANRPSWLVERVLTEARAKKVSRR